MLFASHAATLFEFFWEDIEQFLSTRQHLLTGDIFQTFYCSVRNYVLIWCKIRGELWKTLLDS